MKKHFSSTLAGLFLAAACLGQSANMKTVMANYEHFGKGEIAAIIANCAPDAIFSHAANPEVVPFGGIHVGLEGVGQFFQKVGMAGPITSFVPSDYQENGHHVWNTVKAHGKSNDTGKEHDSELTFVWTFDEAGKVIRWTAVGDTRGMEMAFTK